MEFGQWDAMGIYRGRSPGQGQGLEEEDWRRSEVSKWALCCMACMCYQKLQGYTGTKSNRFKLT